MVHPLLITVRFCSISADLIETRLAQLAVNCAQVLTLQYRGPRVLGGALCRPGLPSALGGEAAGA
jgi:hypothetical protein